MVWGSGAFASKVPLSLRERAGERGDRIAVRPTNPLMGYPAQVRTSWSLPKKTYVMVTPAAFAIPMPTASGSLITSALVTRNTLNPCCSKYAARSRSFSARSSWLAPSISTTSPISWQKKSTTYGPIGCCRRNFSPPSRPALNLPQTIFSGHVLFAQLASASCGFRIWSVSFCTHDKLRSFSLILVVGMTNSFYSNGNIAPHSSLAHSELLRKNRG